MDLEIARIHHFGFNRQAFEITAPVALFDHDADVNFVAGPINATLGKNERVQTFRPDIFGTIDFEPRKIQDTVLASIGHKRDVVAVAGYKRHRQFFALGFFDGGKSAVTVGGRFRCLDRDAILAEDFNGRVTDRLAGFDRHQKNVAAAVGAFLGQNSKIGHEKEATVFD